MQAPALTAQRAQRRDFKPVYDPSFPLSSGGGIPPLRGAGWLRPLACDFRRFRFSRSASLSRSCREQRFECLLSPLSDSSFIVRVLQHIAETLLSSKKLAPFPQQTRPGWHDFVSTGNKELLPPL